MKDPIAGSGPLGYSPDMHPDNKPRCGWVGNDPDERRYHDEEWGVPIHEDRRWFELLVLDGFEPGLSWGTILRKRKAFARVFHRFNPARVARMTEAEVAAALENPAIVRNARKIRAAIRNARAFRAIQKEFGSFDRYIWSVAGGRTFPTDWRTEAEVPASTPLSHRVSRALRARGFTFVGPVNVQATLQAGGIFYDHPRTCFKYRAPKRGRLSPRPFSFRSGGCARTG